MQSTAWLDLIGRIPPAQHHNLMLLTTIGTELAVQGVLRLEENYVVLRGRVAGTTDSGRIFFVPYDQINYVGFIKPVKEREILAMYGEEGPPEKDESPETTGVPEAQAELPATEAGSPCADTASQPDEPAAVEATEAIETAKAEPQPKTGSKNALLERLRARRATAPRTEDT